MVLLKVSLKFIVYLRLAGIYLVFVEILLRLYSGLV